MVVLTVFFLVFSLLPVLSVFLFLSLSLSLSLPPSLCLSPFSASEPISSATSESEGRYVNSESLSALNTRVRFVRYPA